MLRSTIVNSDNENLVSDEDRNTILNWISWEEEPYFYRPGRTSWYNFRKPISGYKAAKLKGIGFWNPASGVKLPMYNGFRSTYLCDIKSLPKTEIYTGGLQQNHFNISNDGCLFLMKKSSPAPLGGISSERAMNEYSNAKRLQSVPIDYSLAPFISGYYNDLRFGKQNLGFVVTISKDSYPYCVDTLLYMTAKGDKVFDIFFDDSCDSLGLSGLNVAKDEDRLLLLGKIFKRYGDSLRVFCEQGMFLHSGGIDNIIYSPLTQRVLLTDLDSCKHIIEVDQNKRFLQNLRDTSSVLYKIICRLTDDTIIRSYSLNSLMNVNLVECFMSGFFYDVKYEFIKKISSNMWESLLKVYWTYRKSMSHSESPSTDMNRKFIFIYLIIQQLDIYKSSGLWRLYPSNIDYQDILEDSNKFLAQEFNSFKGLFKFS